MYRFILNLSQLPRPSPEGAGREGEGGAVRALDGDEAAVAVAGLAAVVAQTQGVLRVGRDLRMRHVKTKNFMTILAKTVCPNNLSWLI